MVLICFQGLSAQNVPWTTSNVSTVTSSLQIKCIPKVDGIAISAGDYIGVFSNGGKCYGLSKYNDSATMVSVNGSNGITDGFKNGDTILFKVWLYKEDCILENVTKVTSDTTLIYNTLTKNNIITELNFQKKTILYPIIEVCQNHADFSPQFNFSINNITFGAESGLNINKSTGTISPVKSIAGTYTVLMNSKYCLTSKSQTITLNEIPQLLNIADTFICGEKLNLIIPPTTSKVDWSTGFQTSEVEFTETTDVWYTLTNAKGCINSDTISIKKMEITDLGYTIDKADCYQKGSLNLISQKIANGKPPYSFKLINQLDNSETADLNNVQEGVYSMEVINSNGCALKYQKTILIDKDCLNDKPVFTPNEDGLDDKYFIKFEGEIMIYDRNGTIKRKLSGPCYFDGLDSSGNPLSMGTYLVVSKRGDNITLTIIR